MSDSLTASKTSNGHEIENPRELLSFGELKSMTETYGLNGSNPEERAAKLKATSPDVVAAFLSDVNRRIQGSEDTLVHEKSMKIAEAESVAPEDRYDLFVAIDQMIKASGEDINPERVGDALALATVLLHPFKDGNGRTARLIGYMYREDFDEPEAAATFSQISESRDAIRERGGGYMLNGYIPYMGEGSNQSDPASIEQYFDRVLSDPTANLYTGPYGQAELHASQQAQVATETI